MDWQAAHQRTNAGKNGNKVARNLILRRRLWCYWYAGIRTRWHDWTKSRRGNGQESADVLVFEETFRLSSLYAARACFRRQRPRFKKRNVGHPSFCSKDKTSRGPM